MEIKSNGSIIIAHGDSFYKSFTYKDSDGVGYNFTGCHMRFVVRKGLHTEPVIDIDDTAGITLTTTGIIILAKSAAEMALIPEGQYIYDWIFTNASGIITTWFNQKPFIITGRSK